jgi:archaemetzincin
MKTITVVPLGAVPTPLLGAVVEGIVDAFGVACEVARLPVDPALAFHAERQQYHSSELLRLLLEAAGPSTGILVGLTSVDLYVPIMTFVFGEAQVEGHAAVVGYHRLREEFYGLPGNPDLLLERATKEAVHEVGHTLGLAHCDDSECVMASSHSVEYVDLKRAAFCPTCAAGLAGRFGGEERIIRP